MAELPTASLTLTEVAHTVFDVALREADALAFTSRHGVRGAGAFASSLVDWWVAGGRVAAVGAATQRAILAELGAPAGATPVLTPPAAASTGAGLADALAAALGPGGRVLHACGAHARPELGDTLRDRGLSCARLVLYRNDAPAAPSRARVRAVAGIPVVYLAAPSAADRLFSWVPALREATLVAIGPTTAAHVESRHGVTPSAVAQDPSLDAVAAAIGSAVTAAQAALTTDPPGTTS